MKRKQFSAEQFVAVLKQAELGLPVAGIIQQVASGSRCFAAGRSSTRGCSRIRCANLPILRNNLRAASIVAIGYDPCLGLVSGSLIGMRQTNAIRMTPSRASVTRCQMVGIMRMELPSDIANKRYTK